MARLFIFGIGGTGARVIKSLTFLLASGVEMQGISEVVPILIDPDISNGDLERSRRLLELYQRIRAAGGIQGAQAGRFFGGSLKTLSSLNPSSAAQNNFHFALEDIRDRRFRDYIDYSSFGDTPNGALAGMLFSQENLSLQMEVGFEGNPNIGSVVLSQLEESEAFKTFAANFQQGDRIFIINSIFGGTGAAGFPLLLKTIRSADPKLPNAALLRDAVIGALTVLPYFSLNDKGRIDGNTFISKTKAALTYYMRTINGEQQLNAFYTLGDMLTKVYENNEGQAAQKNDAHFVELAGAMAIFDFAKDSHSTVGGVAQTPRYREYGLDNDSEHITFADLSPVSKALISKPLTAYRYAALYAQSKLLSDLKDSKIPYRKAFPEQFEVSGLRQDWFAFNDMFEEWLAEMARNRRAFAPFAPLDPSNAFVMVNGIKAETGFFGDIMGDKSIEVFTHELNKQASNFGHLTDPQHRGFALYNSAFQAVIANKFKQAL